MYLMNMKQSLFYFIISISSVLPFLFSCEKVDLGSIETRLTEIEGNNSNMDIKTELISFSILAKDNPKELVNDVVGLVIGDSIIECWSHQLMKSKYLKPEIIFNGNQVLIDGESYNENQKYDFSRPVYLKVDGSTASKCYRVYLHSFTGLPVIWIETDNRQEITSKEEYLHARFRLEENVVTRAAGDVIETDVSIKGRGNNTWLDHPKKPYRLKFNEKISLLDEPADKSWVLLANYYDKTMLRNYLSFCLGHISNLEYTPHSHFVELILNGRYNGTYQLTDKLKISKNRARPGGVLLEVDRYAPREEDARYFKTDSLKFPINIKDPEVEYNDSVFNYTKQFVIEAEKALFSDKFKDPELGWQHYMDINTFVDWYIITELAKSAETVWMTSYLTLKQGEKLMMGPLWDYDKSYGNFYRSDFPMLESPQGFWVKNSSWFRRLFQDEAFVLKLKERMPYFQSRLEKILNEINESAQYLSFSAEENNKRWDIFYHTNPNNSNDYDIWGNYQNEVQCLKEWFIARLNWLSSEIDKM